MNVKNPTASTTQPTPTPSENRVVLKGVSWQTFKALMADINLSIELKK